VQGARAMSSAAASAKAPAQTYGVSGRYASALWQHANKVGALEKVPLNQPDCLSSLESRPLESTCRWARCSPILIWRSGRGATHAMWVCGNG
jgi:hypothetical protein